MPFKILDTGGNPLGYLHAEDAPMIGATLCINPPEIRKGEPIIVQVQGYLHLLGDLNGNIQPLSTPTIMIVAHVNHEETLQWVRNACNGVLR